MARSAHVSRWLLVLGLAVLTPACGPTSGLNKTDAGTAPPVDAGVPVVDSAPLPHVLSSITVTPANPIVQLDLNATGAQAFIAKGNYEDGTSEDISTQATWTVSNAKVGTMTGATLNIPAFTTATAEVATVTASLSGVQGTAQITVVAYRKSGAQQDFFFILPYNDTMGPKTQPLDFSTAIPALDTFFLMDTTGSMGGEIGNLQNALNTTVIPGIKNAVMNSEFGVGALEDFPLNPYGNTSCTVGDGTDDQPFKLRQAITSNITKVKSAVNGLSNAFGNPIGCGNDWPEGGIEAIYQAATGAGINGPSPISVPKYTGSGLGGVGFRKGTMPVIVDISDADSHAKSATGSCSSTGDAEAYSGTVASVAHTRAQTKTALANICARVVGIAAIQTSLDKTCSPLAYMRDLATSTGALVPPAAWDPTRPTGCLSNQCCTGIGGKGVAPNANGLCPVVFKTSTTGTGVSKSVVTGIQMLTRFATFDVPTKTLGQTTDTSGNPLPMGHTTADFIKAVTPKSYQLPPPPPTVKAPTMDSTTFHGVTPGTTVTFDVNAFNDFIMQTDQPQIFRATIQVLAGGCTPLDARSVLILVPPKPIVVQ